MSFRTAKMHWAFSCCVYNFHISTVLTPKFIWPVWVLLWQAALGLKAFPFISNSVHHLATLSGSMHLSPALSLGSKSFVTGLWLYEQVSRVVFGHWFNGGRGYWWAAPRVCQNSFKSGIFWCLLPLMMCGVITSLLEAAPSIFALPCSLSLSLAPSVCPYQCVCYQRGWEERGRNNISTRSSLHSKQFHHDVAKAELYCIKRRQSGACTCHWICDGIIFPKTYLTAPLFAWNITA